MGKQQYSEEKRQSPIEKIISSQLFKSLVIGLVATLTSWVVVGFNLSANSGIRVNDTINRYFDTCVGEFFTETTPRIDVDERGFPLAYIQSINIPICNDRSQPSSEVLWSVETYFEIGAFAANVLFWACLTFVIMRSYVRRRHIKVTRSA